jgi:hypothetical protein
MAGARRVEMDWAAYLRLARRACFVCELLAGNPDYSHHVIHRDELAAAFLSRFPVWPGHLLVAPAMHVEDVVAADVAQYLAAFGGAKVDPNYGWSIQLRDGRYVGSL